jgi:hypothetical protein
MCAAIASSSRIGPRRSAGGPSRDVPDARIEVAVAARQVVQAFPEETSAPRHDAVMLEKGRGDGPLLVYSHA